MSKTSNTPLVTVIDTGPTGLMAAEVLSRNGMRVEVFDAMPSTGRELLLTDIGGMNITHSKSLDTFLGRYRTRRKALAPLIGHFSPDVLCVRIHGLGIGTLVGSSGRMFPAGMRAAPLLRAWLHRLRGPGVQLYMQYRWVGWAGPSDHAQMLCFETAGVERLVQADAVVPAMGSGSWPRLGSDGAWVLLLEACGVQVQPLRPASCRFDADWNAYFQERFTERPVKSATIGLRSAEDGALQFHQGELVVTQTDTEGGLVYALSAPIQNALAVEGSATIQLGLAPGWSAQRVTDELVRPRDARSMSSHLQSKLNITGVKLGLLHECLSKEAFADSTRLTRTIRVLSLRPTRTRPIEEATSTVGGIAFEALDVKPMTERLPDVFCAGKMLDWEMPTGGYLLTACFISGATVEQDALDYPMRAAR